MTETVAPDYHQMWAELGLDLPMHDALLEAVGGMYGATFMTQNNRPEGMGYLDFVMSEVHGLRIKELDDFRKAGGKVVGTYCLYVPEELIRAAGAWSVGICAGAEWAYDQVEQILPRNTCALIKSMMGFKLGKVCPYLEEADLLIGETTCDGKKKAYEELGKLQNMYVMELPQMKRAKDVAFWRSELVDLIAKLEDLTGKKITAESLERVHQGGQRQAPRPAARQRRPCGRPRADLRPRLAARRAGRLLRRRAALHADDERTRRRAREARRRRRRRSAEGRQARADHRHADGTAELEAPRDRGEGRWRRGRRRDVHRLALLREARRRGRRNDRRHARRPRGEVPRHQLRLLHAQRAVASTTSSAWRRTSTPTA